MTAPTRRYAAALFLTIAAILVPVYVITGLDTNPYPDPVDFSRIPEASFLPVNRLSDRYQTTVKLRFATTYPPPDVGVFGTHAVQFMSQGSIGKGGPRVFNYFVTHLGMPEIYTYLQHLETLGKLPKRLILVGIHNPHTDNFPHISLNIWELPLQLYLTQSEMRITNRIRFTLQRYAATVRDRLDWRNLAYKLYSGALFGCQSAYGVRPVTSAVVVQQPKPNELRGAAWLQKFGMRPPATDCEPTRGFRADGSFVLTAQTPAPNLTPESQPVKGPSVSPEVVPGVVGALRNINAIGARNGRQVVFFVPPYFETPRSSQRYELLDRIITALPEDVLLIDDRRGFHNRRFYFDRMHPNAIYFRDLMNRLRSRGVI